MIVAWLGLRNVITILLGSSQMGPLKPGQRLCHVLSLLIYWGACGLAIYYRIWWPLAIGLIIELLFRKSTIRSGDIACRLEIEMMFAVRTNNMTKLMNLIEKGADINWQDSRVDGVTALHEASQKGNIEIVKYLLQEGSNVHLQNYNGFTALHVAAYTGENEIVRTLIAAGADVNAQAKDNVTPLHAAASMGHIDTVQLLVSSGAKVHATTSKKGETPKDFAISEGHQNICEFLSDY